MPGDNVPDIDRDRPAPLVCATVTGATAAELRANRDRVAGADLIELRLDYVDRPDVASALAGRTTPVIVTCRPAWEGGRFAGSERERLGLLGAALAAGAEFVDVEWRAEHKPLIRRHGGDRIVISTHDFEGIPNDIGDRYRAMRATGAAVVKVAAATRGLCDTLALAALGRGAESERRVVIGMGPAGIASRVLAGRFGSCWTYAGEGVAPGQIELPRLRDEYRFPAITRRTAIYGVVGAPVSHSLSPAMHNAGFAEAGLDAVYLPLEARDVDDFVQFAAAVPLRGVSVTAPFKEALAARVTDVDPIGRQVGAINTVRCGDTGWQGLNTDVPGFVETLLGRLRLPGGARSGPRSRRRGARGGGGAGRRGRRGRHLRARRSEGRCRGGGGRGRGRRLSAPRRLVGPAGEHHAGRHLAGRRGDAAPRRAVQGAARLRPRLQPRDHPAPGRCRGGRVRHDRRAGHAGGAGGPAIRVVDRPPSVRTPVPGSGRAGAGAPGRGRRARR